MRACPPPINAATARSPLTHYAIVRADIPHGMQAAQLIHAAGESSPGKLPDGTYAVALHARDEQHLRSIAGFLEAAHVPHNLIVENDAPYAGQAMAIGIVPDERHRLRRLLSSLPLVR